MATFVLVHPAWFGGWCWRKVATPLRAAGHAVHTPTLTGLGERAHLAEPGVGLGTHVNDVVNLITYEDLGGVILVGSSSGGTVVAAAADRVPERIDQVVFLDAFVPADGQSTLDLLAPDRRAGIESLVEQEGDGWLVPRIAPPPWERFLPDAWRVTDQADLDWVLPRLCPTPLAHFTEPAHLPLQDGERPRRWYVRCADYPNLGFDRFAATARSDPAWGYHELAASHLPYITSPADLTGLLLDLAR